METLASLLVSTACAVADMSMPAFCPMPVEEKKASMVLPPQAAKSGRTGTPLAVMPPPCRIPASPPCVGKTPLVEAKPSKGLTLSDPSSMERFLYDNHECGGPDSPEYQPRYDPDSPPYCPTSPSCPPHVVARVEKEAMEKRIKELEAKLSALQVSTDNRRAKRAGQSARERNPRAKRRMEHLERKQGNVQAPAPQRGSSASNAAASSSRPSVDPSGCPETKSVGSFVSSPVPGPVLKKPEEAKVASQAIPDELKARLSQSCLAARQNQFLPATSGAAPTPHRAPPPDLPGDVTDESDSSSSDDEVAPEATANKVPENFNFVVWCDEELKPIVEPRAFTWWNPFTWWRPFKKMYKRTGPEVKFEGTYHRGVHEDETKMLRLSADVFPFDVVVEKSHWVWQDPKRVVVKNYHVSGVMLNSLLDRFSTNGIPDLVSLESYAARVTGINCPRGIVQLEDGRAVNLSNIYRNTCYVARDVIAAGLKKTSQLFRYGPAARGEDARYNSGTASAMSDYLHSLPVSLLRSLCSLSFWRTVAQSTLVWWFMSLAQLYLPPTYFTHLASSLAHGTASSGSQ